MDMQNVSNLQIPEGEVRTIHDKDGRLLWGRLNYNTKYAGDTYQQTYSGKNLFPLYVIATGTNNGITFTNNGDSISLQGTATANIDRGQHIALGNVPSSLIKNGSRYTLSLSQALPTGVNVRVLFYSSTASTGVNVATLSGNGSRTSATGNAVAVPENATRIRWFINVQNGTTVNISNLKIQLTEGSTPDYDFEPYVGGIPAPSPDYPQDIQVVTGEQTVAISGEDQSQEYEINLGKNLFDKATATVLSGAINSDLTYTSGGNARTVFIPCEPNTKYSASKITQGSRTRLGSCTGRIDTDGGSLTYYTQTYNDVNSRRIVELTTGPNDKYLYFTFGQTSDAVAIQDLVDSIQIEVGDSTSYAPYFTPIELCKIGDYRDYIYKSGDNWYIHKETGRRTYSGSDVYLDSHSYTNIKYAAAPKPTDSDAYGVYGQKLMYCTHASATGNTGTWDSAQNIGKILSGAAINVYWLGFPPNTTLDTMQTALDGSVLYYVLATPTDTQITDTMLIGQLNAVHEWLTRYGYNATVTGNLPLIIDKTNL